MQEFHTTIGAGGRVVIPSSMRKELKLEVGENVVLRIEDHNIKMVSLKQTLEEARALFREVNKGKKSMTDELIAMRRQEAKDE